MSDSPGITVAEAETVTITGLQSYDMQTMLSAGGCRSNSFATAIDANRRSSVSGLTVDQAKKMLQAAEREAEAEFDKIDYERSKLRHDLKWERTKDWAAAQNRRDRMTGLREQLDAFSG